MARKRLYLGEETSVVSITVSREILENLKIVAAKFGLEPAAYVRSLVATHLLKNKE